MYKNHACRNTGSVSGRKTTTEGGMDRAKISRKYYKKNDQSTKKKEKGRKECLKHKW